MALVGGRGALGKQHPRFLPPLYILGDLHSEPRLPAWKPRLSLAQPTISTTIGKMIVLIQDMGVLGKALHYKRKNIVLAVREIWIHILDLPLYLRRITSFLWDSV